MNATELKFQAQTNVETAKASRYLQALCGHFSSKVKTEWTKVAGEVDFGFGRCSMTADDSNLVINVYSETEEALPRLKHFMTRHLEKFAVNEGLKITTWENN